MTKPCQIPGCSTPKEPGKGSRYCATHRQERLVVRWEVQSAMIRRPYSPCERCGGPKVAEGERARQGQKFCDPCKEITQGAAKERKKVKARERARLIRGSVQTRKPPKPKPEPKPKRVRVVREKPKVPAEVRAAWRAGHENSIIRRKFPKIADLERHYAT